VQTLLYVVTFQRYVPHTTSPTSYERTQRALNLSIPHIQNIVPEKPTQSNPNKSLDAHARQAYSMQSPRKDKCPIKANAPKENMSLVEIGESLLIESAATGLVKTVRRAISPRGLAIDNIGFNRVLPRRIAVSAQTPVEEVVHRGYAPLDWNTIWVNNVELKFTVSNLNKSRDARIYGIGTHTQTLTQEDYSSVLLELQGETLARAKASTLP